MSIKVEHTPRGISKDKGWGRNHPWWVLVLPYICQLELQQKIIRF